MFTDTETESDDEALDRVTSEQRNKALRKALWVGYCCEHTKYITDITTDTNLGYELRIEDAFELSVRYGRHSEASFHAAWCRWEWGRISSGSMIMSRDVPKAPHSKLGIIFALCENSTSQLDQAMLAFAKQFVNHYVGSSTSEHLHYRTPLQCCFYSSLRLWECFMERYFRYTSIPPYPQQLEYSNENSYSSAPWRSNPIKCMYDHRKSGYQMCIAGNDRKPLRFERLFLERTLCEYASQKVKADDAVFLVTGEESSNEICADADQLIKVRKLYHDEMKGKHQQALLMTRRMARQRPDEFQIWQPWLRDVNIDNPVSAGLLDKARLDAIARELADGGNWYDPESNNTPALSPSKMEMESIFRWLLGCHIGENHKDATPVHTNHKEWHHNGPTILTQIGSNKFLEESDPNNGDNYIDKEQKNDHNWKRHPDLKKFLELYYLNLVLVMRDYVEPLCRLIEFRRQWAKCHEKYRRLNEEFHSSSSTTQTELTKCKAALSMLKRKRSEMLAQVEQMDVQILKREEQIHKLQDERKH